MNLFRKVILNANNTDNLNLRQWELVYYTVNQKFVICIDFSFQHILRLPTVGKFYSLAERTHLSLI